MLEKKYYIDEKRSISMSFVPKLHFHRRISAPLVLTVDFSRRIYQSLVPTTDFLCRIYESFGMNGLRAKLIDNATNFARVRGKWSLTVKLNYRTIFLWKLTYAAKKRMKYVTVVLFCFCYYEKYVLKIYNRQQKTPLLLTRELEI